MSKELQQAIERYPNASPEVQKELRIIFGDKPFLPKRWETVKKFEDAHPIFLKLKTKDPMWLLLQKRKVSELSVIERLMIIAEVLRDGWFADYTDSDQEKWFPVHTNNGSGFVFSLTFYGYAHTNATCGSRLALPNSDLAKYFGTQFLKEWNDLLTIKQ